MRVLFLAMLFVLGACFGSFLCCQARRLRLKELAEQGKTAKKARQPDVSARNQKRLTTQKKSSKSRPAHSLGNRSVCLHCRKQLKWYDNIPLISWPILRGKCRYCGQKIGLLEPFSELGLAFAFLLLGLNTDLAVASPLVWISFVVSLIFVCLLGFLTIYDAAYGELPTVILIVSIFSSILLAILNQTIVYQESGWTLNLILAPLGAVAILGGIYLVLYLVSKGNWVGDGDWLLGIALGAALASPWLALIALCLANLLAFLIALPRYHKHLKIPLGPFLIAAFVLVYSWRNFFLNLL